MAMIEDDEIIQVFIEESHDHMDGIESDLLDIEKDGENVNVDLVNKVFRAIHSVKGGAGFLGLDNIKELSHEMENLLNLIRNKELVPSSALINRLLNATDKLNELINNFAESNEIDISEEIVTLKGATTSSLPEENKESVENLEEVKLADGKVIFELKSFDLDQAQKVGRILYLAEFDLIRDIERKGKTPLDVIKEIQQAGIFVEGKIDIDAIGTLEEQSNTMCVPFFVLFATVLEQNLVGKLVNLDDSKIFYFNQQREMFPVQQTATNALPEINKEEQNETTNVFGEFVNEMGNSNKKVKDKEKSTSMGYALEVKESVLKISSESLSVNVKDVEHLKTLANELVLTCNKLLKTHHNDN